MRNRLLSLRRILTIAMSAAITFTFAGALVAQETGPELHHMRPEPTHSGVSSSPAIQTQQLVPTATLNSTTWTNIGPAPDTGDSPLSEAAPNTGRVQGIAADPTLANTIYVATSGGGVWKTIDGGTTWTALTDTQKTLALGAIAMAPSDSNVLYAGTGTPDSGGNYGRGVLVSQDGGMSWTLQTNGGVFDRHGVSEIAVDPKNPGTAYVAIACCGTNSVLDLKNGVYKTTDFGATWTFTTDPFTTSVGVFTSVRIDPNTSGSTATLYGAAGYQFGNVDNGVYKSKDAGTTWTKLTDAKLPSGTTAGRIVVAVSKCDPATPPATGCVANSNVVYVAASGTGTAGSAPFGSLYKFLRSDDGGATWTDLTATTPNYMNGQGWFDTTLIVDPTNSAIVYAAGSSGTNSVIKSTDKGVTWTDIHGTGQNGLNGPHVDHHASAFDANGKFLDGNDGGIWRLESVDTAMPPKATWTSLNGSGNGTLSTFLLNSIAINSTSVNTALGAAQDNGVVLYSGVLSWPEVSCGDGKFVRFNPTMTNRAYESCNGSGYFRRSDDTGATWTAKVSGITDTGSNLNFFPPFAVDPKNGDRVVLGERHAWETSDAGETWTSLGPVTTDTFGANIDAIGLADDPKTIYVSAGGNVWVTEDKGKKWTKINLPVSGKVASISVASKDRRRAVAVVGAFTTGGNVFHTTDLGKTWTNIGTSSSGFPNLPAWSAAFHGDSINTIYVGADDGLYRTTDKGGTWNRFGSGLPNAQVFDLQLDTTTLNILAAATYGRGAWEINLPPPTTTTVAAVTGTTGATVTLTATVKPTGVPGTVKFEVGGVPVGGTATYDSTTGIATQSYTITQAAGTYTITADFASSDETLGGNSGGVNTLTVM